MVIYTAKAKTMTTAGTPVRWKLLVGNEIVEQIMEYQTKETCHFIEANMVSECINDVI